MGLGSGSSGCWSRCFLSRRASPSCFMTAQAWVLDQILLAVRARRLNSGPGDVGKYFMSQVGRFRMLSTHVCTHLLSFCCPEATKDTSMCQEGAQIAILLEQLEVTSVVDVQQAAPMLMKNQGRCLCEFKTRACEGPQCLRVGRPSMVSRAISKGGPCKTAIPCVCTRCRRRVCWCLKV